MPLPRRPDPLASSRPRARHLAAALVAAFVLLVLGLVGPAALQPDPSGAAPTSTTTTSTSKSSTTASTSAPTTAPPTSAAPTTARPTTSAPATTTAAPGTTSTTAATTTSTATGGTLAPPPPASNAPFPASLVAPVPHADGGPQLDITDLYEAVSQDPSTPDLVVRFGAPFPLPSTSYKVSVLVGDPTGARLRVSLVSTNPSAKPQGTVETSDGPNWRDTGTTKVTFDPGGFVIINLPLASAPPGGSIWTEITEAGANVPARITPYYSRDGLLATTAPTGSLASSPWANVAAAGAATTGVPTPSPPGPVLTVGNGLASLVYADAAPTQIDGQAVTEVVDSLRIAPNFDNGATVTDFVRINRTDGTIGLFDGFAFQPVDKSGAKAWLLGGLPSVPGAPGTVVVDLQAAATALGITLAPTTAGYGVLRTFTLADGRVVTGEAVLGTSRWFDLGPAPTAPTSTTPGAAVAVTDAATTTNLPLILAAAAVLIVLLGILVLLLARRRRTVARDAEPEPENPSGNAVAARVLDEPATGEDRVPWGRLDGGVTARATAEIEMTKAATGAVPIVVDDAPTTGPRRAVGVVMAGEAIGDVVAREHGTPPMGVPAVAEPIEPAEPVATEPADPDPGDPDPVEPVPAAVDPLDALAALDLQLGAFRARLDPPSPAAAQSENEGDDTT